MGGVPPEPGSAAADRGPVEYHIVNTLEALKSLAELLVKEKQIAVDLETTSRDPMDASVVGIAFARKAREAWS